MKNILKIIYLLTLGLSLFACCSEKDNPIYYNLKNNSAKAIYRGYSYSYPDTGLKSISNVPLTKAYRMSPKTTEFNSLGHFSYNPTVQIFIFDADVIEKEPWDTIVKYNMFLKRYQFTKAELEKMNWELVYETK